MNVICLHHDPVKKWLLSMFIINEIGQETAKSKIRKKIKNTGSWYVTIDVVELPNYLVNCIIIRDNMKKRYLKWKKTRYKGMTMQYTAKENALKIIEKIGGEHGAGVQIVDKAEGMIYWCLDNRLDTADVSNLMNELGRNGVEVICSLVKKSSRQVRTWQL